MNIIIVYLSIQQLYSFGGRFATVAYLQDLLISLKHGDNIAAHAAYILPVKVIHADIFISPCHGASTVESHMYASIHA